MIFHIRPTVSWVLALITLASPSLIAQQNTAERDTLRGLPGVHILVEKVNAEAEQDGLKLTDLQTDIELKLRLGSVRVFTDAEVRDTTSRPILILTPHIYKAQPYLYAYNVDLDLYQLVTLNSGNQAMGRTWSRTISGTIGSGKIRQLREEIKELMDKLINDWLAANPK